MNKNKESGWCLKKKKNSFHFFPIWNNVQNLGISISVCLVSKSEILESYWQYQCRLNCIDILTCIYR